MVVLKVDDALVGDEATAHASERSSSVAVVLPEAPPDGRRRVIIGRRSMTTRAGLLPGPGACSNPLIATRALAALEAQHLHVDTIAGELRGQHAVVQDACPAPVVGAQVAAG